MKTFDSLFPRREIMTIKAILTFDSPQSDFVVLVNLWVKKCRLPCRKQADVSALSIIF